MSEPQVNALVGTTEVKNFPPVCGVKPTSLGFFHRNGVVSTLDAPALHEVFLLNPAEILRVVFCCAHKTSIFCWFSSVSIDFLIVFDNIEVVFL
jgi:hypothetical protein